jgi:hypothetical protein
MFCMALPAVAQDLTGTWEGNLGTDQFIQINIVQKGDKICGYTYDYVLDDRRSHCKAFFNGYYNKSSKKWQISGTSFIENSGSHVLMQLGLTPKFVNDEPVLEQKADARSTFLALINGLDPPLAVYVKKVSDKPTRVYQQMKDCFPEPETIKDTVVKPKQPEITREKPVVPSIKTDTPTVTVPPPVIKNTDSIALATKVEQRKNVEQSHIEVNVKNINLKVYDNAVVDGDTVSIYYNGKLLLSHQPLSEKPIEINLELNTSQTRQEIVLFAENLGSIPPNTALVVITAGDKRYELFASASLQENAVLVFDYKPK